MSGRRFARRRPFREWARRYEAWLAALDPALGRAARAAAADRGPALRRTVDVPALLAGLARLGVAPETARRALSLWLDHERRRGCYVDWWRGERQLGLPPPWKCEPAA